MRSSRSIRWSLLGVPAVLALSALAIAGPVRAQEDAEAHPAHVHAGTCAELGDVVVPLEDVTGPAADDARSGPESAIPVEISETAVDLPLQEIIDGGHAINVHLSAEEIETYIACGDIGGAVRTDDAGDSEMIIGLGELNDSGYSGVAWLGADGDATTVKVALTEAGAAGATGAEGTPESGAAGGDSAAEATAVTIKDFAYSPNPIEVPVGGTVTWTNEDGVPHTATAVGDKAVLQSGAIASGASYSQTFDTAGSYDYYCEFHPNMKGTIVVE